MKHPAIVGLIRAPGSKLKVQCRIYPTREDMLRGIRRDVVGGIANSTLACTVHATKSTVMDDAIAAIVFFSRRDVDRGTVAHEMVHAAANIIERRRGKLNDNEEPLALLAGELVNAFYKKFGI